VASYKVLYLFCLILLQSLVGRAQARVGLLREAANAHAEVAGPRGYAAGLDRSRAIDPAREGDHGALGKEGGGRP
jgi:hypothetical protein